MAEELALVKGAFPEKMEVWLIHENLSTLEEFEEVFHRKVRYIKTLDDLIEAVELSPKYTLENSVQFIYASVIFYKAMPASIISELTQVKKVLDIVQKLNIYEVARDDQAFEGSYVYGSLHQLEKEYKGLSRSAYISDLPSEDKQKRVLEELDVELHRVKDALTKQEEGYAKLAKEYKDLLKRNKDLESQIDTEVNINAKAREEELEDTRRSLVDVKDRLDIAEKTLLKRKQEIQVLTDERDSLEYTKETLEQNIVRLRDDVKLRDEDYAELEDEYRTLQEQLADLRLKTSDGERFELITTELASVKLALKTAEKELRQTRISFKNEELRNQDLQRTIELQRRGQIAEEFTGRTAILDHIELKSTDLVYIKVVDNLPYHRSAVSELFTQLDEHYNGKAKLVIINYDDGLNKYRYDGINVYRALDDVDIREKKFLLHPNTSMFTGGERFEEHVELLLVVDYTGGNDYLVTSIALENVFTMVRYPSMMKDDKLGLQGSPLTLGSESVYDLTYDSRIATSGIRTNRLTLIEIKVNEWMNQLKLRRISRNT